MAAKKDLENGNSNSSEPNVDSKNENGNLSEPLIDRKNDAKEQIQNSSNNDGLCMVFFSTFIAVCGSFEFGSCVGYSSPAQFGIMADLKESYSQYSLFGSILTIGAIIGAISSGRIADWVGRKGAMRIASVICTVGWLTISVSSTAPLLDFGRFLTGCGIGVMSYVVPVYIAEITPKNLRGALATANQLFIVTGALVAYVIGALVSWRILAVTGIVPCLVLLVGLCFIPESPRWLAMIGKNQEFEVALSMLRGPNADVSGELNEILESLALINQLSQVNILDLFNKRNIRFVNVGVGLMVFQQAIGINGYIYYAAQIFKSAGVSPNLGSILYASLQVVLTAFGAILMDKAGRRPLLMISVVGLLLGNLLTGMSFLLKGHHLAPDAVPILAVVGVMVYIAFYSIGMGPIPWVIMSEIFPLNIKGPGGSLVTLVNWIGSWAISYSFILLMTWSSWGVFFLYAAFSAISMLFTIKFVPETKGRTLEEVQASMS